MGLYRFLKSELTHMQAVENQISGQYVESIVTDPVWNTGIVDDRIKHRAIDTDV